jgi:hypothetical protein
MGTLAERPELSLLKKQWEKRATKCFFCVCMEKLPYMHEINTFWRAISIHRWITFMLLQQCTV